jgi:hypothetical protein
MSWVIKFLEYQDRYQAEAGTTATNVTLTGHGLSIGDHMVNETRRTRGSRRACAMLESAELDYFGLHYVSILGQTSGDWIRLYKFIDRTDYVKSSTIELTKRVSGGSTCRFTFISKPGDVIPFGGQKIEVHEDGDVIYKGVIANIDVERPDPSLPDLFFSIDTTTLGSVPLRRTVPVDYPIATPFDDIVTDMLVGFLEEEGIVYGDIDVGGELDDDWTDDCISVGDILDRCAEASGFQWFINDIGALYFVEEMPIVAAEYAIDDTATLPDIRNVKVSETLDAYANKTFFTGGSDGGGNGIIIFNDNYTEINARQDKEAGSGVYGTVLRDSSIDDSEYLVAEAGTDTDTITISSHGQYLGYCVWNITRGVRATISNINGINSFEIIPSITGQVAGDKIVVFPTANKIIKNALKKQSTIPRKLTFNSGLLDWTPGKKLYVKYDAMCISASYWIIDSVTIREDLAGADGDDNLICEVIALSRNGSDFSTQPGVRFRDWYTNR